MKDQNSSCCCCCNASRKHRRIATGITGVLLLIVGGFLMFIYNLIFEAVLKEKTSIQEGTIFYSEWKENSQKVYINVFMLNVTNEDEFLSQKPGIFVKPVLHQIGPYVYRARLRKDRISFIDAKPEEVHYRQTYLMTFEPELSIGTEDDVITTVNFIAMLIPPVLEYIFSLPEAENITEAQKKLLYLAANSAVENTDSDLLFTHSVGGLLFGLQDPLLTALVDILNEILVNTNFSDWLPLQDTFGLLMMTNMSLGWQEFNAYTGNPEYELTNIITKFNNKSTLDYWYGEHCNMINGTDSTTRPPLKGKDEAQYYFYGSMARSVFTKFSQEVIVKKLNAWEYVVPSEVYLSPANSEYNRCFCQSDSTEEFCLYDGGFLLRNRLLGMPLLLSAPHFLHGDGYYLDRVSGLKPNTEEHQTVFTYEPYTGACVKADRRVQFNIYMRPYDSIRISQRITEVFAFPVFWMNLSYVMEDDTTDLLYGLIVIGEEVVLVFQITMCTIGGVLLAFLLIVGIRSKIKHIEGDECKDTKNIRLKTETDKL